MDMQKFTYETPELTVYPHYGNFVAGDDPGSNTVVEPPDDGF